MNLGLSVFLSTLIIGLILLYINTKDTWNWTLFGKTIKRILVVPLVKIIKWALITLIVIFLVLVIYWLGSCVENGINNLPHKLVEYEGVKLGETKQEVIDNCGKPNYYSTKAGKIINPFNCRDKYNGIDYIVEHQCLKDLSLTSDFNLPRKRMLIN